MEEQIHLRLYKNPLDFTKITYDFKEFDPSSDRVGGFWTSTYSTDSGCDWLHKKLHKPFAHVYIGYLFSVDPSTKIYVIDSHDAVKYFEEYYKGDFNNLAMDYDGIHLSHSYLIELKKNKLDETRFYFWGVECTWWFNVNNLVLVRTLNGDEITKLANGISC